MVDTIIQYATASPWLHYALKIALLVLAAFLVRHVVVRLLRRVVARTASELDDALVDLLDHAIRPLLALAVLTASINLFPLTTRAQQVVNRGLSLLLLGVALYYGFRALRLLLEHWIQGTDGRESMKEPLRFGANVLFAGIAVMILLDNLGVSLTAVWTTLGVGSVAIALALQDTLSNFFAGVYLRLDRPVRIGDFVKLENGDEGFVIAMGWRSTQIRSLPNNVSVVPNAKLASSTVVNYSLPEPQMSLLVNVGVSYDSDPQQVEDMLIAEALAAAEYVPGLLTDPAPFVRFIPGFGESALEFTLICRVSTFVDQYLAQHEIRKRILARFRREGIVIPFPQRDVHLYPAASEAFAPRTRAAALENEGRWKTTGTG